MRTGTIVLVGKELHLRTAVAEAKEKNYSVIGVQEWPQGDYLLMPTYSVSPVQNPFKSLEHQRWKGK